MRLTGRGLRANGPDHRYGGSHASHCDYISADAFCLFCSSLVYLHSNQKPAPIGGDNPKNKNA
ncbi:hypothetical protein EYF80_050659 [Liparis tanakae]|uniref:Uncharacterized protein n=1 Tax=Liparis tanakae TaxID=230148 RepID=A0A4Z2FDW5_9TELE|nr:hypothetical protein EYF80_050659 [Liparis tanakae]